MIKITKLLLSLKNFKIYNKMINDSNNKIVYDNYLFEISWEVAHKDGGIYTVISSKANEIKKKFPNYILIGAKRDEENHEFKSLQIPKEFENAAKELEDIGIKIHYGEWLIEAKPKTILVEYLKYSKNINDIKTKLWERYNIDSLNSDWYDFDEVILWSWCCGIVIEKITNHIINNQNRVLVHTHEWMSGGAIFYLKSLENNDKFRCISTTHATMLARALSSRKIDIKNKIEKIDSIKEAYNIGIQTKHLTEKSISEISDTFTTVSDITGKEVEVFFNKKPDILLYNGFDNSTIPNFENLKIISKISREKTNNFLKSYFHDFYDIDIKNAKIFFTSGRNEFVNKGVDLYINSLSKLNRKLKEENYQKEVLNLFLIPIGNFQQDPLIKKSIENYKNKIKREFIKDFAPLSTHIIPIENEIIKAFLENNLLNKKEDKVKVILIPIYLNNQDETFKRDYYELILGLDYSIFPSYYEPWGYTPLESLSYAVPTLTTDLTGFGLYSNKLNYKTDALKVIKRDNLTFEDASYQIYEQLIIQINKTEEQILKQKKESYQFAQQFDWKIFIQNYLKAYDFALKKYN